MTHAITPSQAQPRVLVIDDAVTVRLYCRKLLQDGGFAVSEAANGLEALEIALSEPFDLFVVDINMQRMDGYAFLREARRQAALVGAPALMMSTEAAAADIEKAYAAGANFYLLKPIRPEPLLRAARLLTGRRIAA
jgi:two-component system, chemotaxis family, chemotaxis protein CheY